ncbi:CLUMA_CG003658, isoform A [Clunio marinus]|uniref:CLUMA_CG003658, isoform A n=1 Tax=Clunio marinus TaxID=568069 RepID=A0A1J1HPF3_9DIPT|nr:CLUMA_CG003658, isoform A [Clunio marinus]
MAFLVAVVASARGYSPELFTNNNIYSTDDLQQERETRNQLKETFGYGFLIFQHSVRLHEGRRSISCEHMLMFDEKSTIEYCLPRVKGTIYLHKTIEHCCSNEMMSDVSVRSEECVIRHDDPLKI